MSKLMQFQRLITALILVEKVNQNLATSLLEFPYFNKDLLWYKPLLCTSYIVKIMCFFLFLNLNISFMTWLCINALAIKPLYDYCSIMGRGTSVFYKYQQKIRMFVLSAMYGSALSVIKL